LLEKSFAHNNNSENLNSNEQFNIIEPLAVPLVKIEEQKIIITEPVYESKKSANLNGINLDLYFLICYKLNLFLFLLKN
jgi:hypothetical protein